MNTFLLICSLSLPVSAIGGEEAAPRPGPRVMARCLSVLRAALDQETEFWPAMHAAEGLTQAGHGAEVLAALKGRLEQETDDQRRCGLAREQVRAGKNEYVQVMLSILADPKSNGRVHACESLFKVGRTGDGKLLRAALAEDDPKLIMMAAAALIRGGDRALLPNVRRFLTSRDVESRRIAAWVLGQVGDRSDWRALQKLEATETEPLSRSYVVNALAKLGAPGALEKVAANLRSQEGAIRTYSAQTLGASRAVGHWRDLVPLLDDPILDVRVRAAQSILLLARTKKQAP